MEEIYIGLILVGSLLVPRINISNNEEEEYTKHFTGVDPAKFHHSLNFSRALEEFQIKAKEIWDKQPLNDKNLGDVMYEIHMKNQRGYLSSDLEKVIDFEKRNDSDFLSKQVVVSLQKEINSHIAEQLQNKSSIPEISRGLEESEEGIRRWISKYHLDKPSFLNDPRYFYVNDDLRYEKGYSVSASKGYSNKWITPDYTSEKVTRQRNRGVKTTDSQFKNVSIPMRDPKSSSQRQSERLPAKQPFKANDSNKLKNHTTPKKMERNFPRTGINEPIKTRQRATSTESKRFIDSGYSSTFSHGQSEISRRGNLRIKSVGKHKRQLNRSQQRSKYYHLPGSKTNIWNRIKKLFQNKTKISLFSDRKSSRNQISSNNFKDESKNPELKSEIKQIEDDVINQIIDYLNEGNNEKWISRVTGVSLDFIRNLKKKNDSLNYKKTSRRNQSTKDLRKQRAAIEPQTIRDFHGLEQLPLCCDLPSDKELKAKLDKLPIKLQAELSELMEYGFQPYAMKDWITKDILSEITGIDPNLLRDEKFRKSRFDFRDPSSWGEILKGSREFYSSWKEGNYALLHEVFFSAFLNRVLTEAENYLHPSFTRNHPKIRAYTREVIDFLDNKYDPDENHGRIVADTSAITEIYATTQIAKLQTFLLHLTHNLTFEEARELVKNSTTLITKKGALGNSFDYLITIDRNKLGCTINENEPRFQIIYGEVKGVTEIVSKAKGSQGTYREIIVGSPNLNRIMTGEDFLIKISDIRYHLKDRYNQLGWDFSSIIHLYKQISNDYVSMVPVAQTTKGRSRFKAMFHNRNSSRSPFHLFQMRKGNIEIKRVEYVDLNELHSYPLDLPSVKIVPDCSKHIRNKFAVYFEGKKFNKQIVDPYDEKDSDKIKNIINKGFGKFSRRILTYFGTSQNGKHTSKKCGFSGRLEGVKDDYLTVVYIAESILNSKNSVSYSSSHLKGNTHNNRWGNLGVNSMVAGKYADPEIAIKNGIIQYYKQLYDQNTTEATNFRRSRRTNWKKSIGILKRKGLMEEAQRYQNFANIVLSEFHAKITSQNTKIQRFRPINDIE